ncbi:hypothetical protein [Spiroplasma endosymbiont of Apeira syringaria]|uniref:hypothetical protein n=1 Tax=Spiroplasma endosymbiont of Apeira syringaria TaxID=3066307 RepID=UPI0030D0AC4B
MWGEVRSLIKADSLFWFLNIVHHLYQELFSLYNNKKFLVFDELLLENLKNSWQWIEKERQIFNEEHNLITELKNIAKEAFPEQYF